MKASLPELLARLPGPRTVRWPEGERFVQAMAHGSMSVELYAPQGHDPQQPHAQDELYIVAAGSAEFVRNGERMLCAAGDVLFVPAEMEHRFERFSLDFSTWVVFWGPKGGEQDGAQNAQPSGELTE
jgi:mannose-6-phosphate isomerase-like protein (cupin superfamily)